MRENKIQQTPARRVIYFLLLLLAFTSAFFLLTSHMQGTPAASLLIMWTPALAAILASFLTRRSFKKWVGTCNLGSGWRLGGSFPSYMDVWHTSPCG